MFDAAVTFPRSQIEPCDCCEATVPCECPVGLGLSPDQLPARPRAANHPSVIIRFMSYVEVSTTKFWRNPETGVSTPCHLWTGGKSRGGMRFSEKAYYGTFNPGGEVKGGVRAHVFIAWFRGLLKALRVPDGMNLDHRCVEALCVNADHLELVTKRENQERKKRR